MEADALVRPINHTYFVLNQGSQKDGKGLQYSLVIDVFWLQYMGITWNYYIFQCLWTFIFIFIFNLILHLQNA